MADGPADQFVFRSGGHRPHVRQGTQRLERTAPEIEAVELDSLWVVAQRQGGEQGADRCDLPLWGAPTTAIWPPAPPASTSSGTRCCSNGRSTTPIEAVSSAPSPSGNSDSRGDVGRGGSQT